MAEAASSINGTPNGSRIRRFFTPEHRPFWLIVANGAIFQLSLALFDPRGVVAAFLMDLTGSSALVGVALAVGPASTTLPQLYESHVLADGRRRMPHYIKGAHTRWGAFACIIAATVLLHRHATLLAWLFLIGVTVVGFGTGIGIVSFGDILTRTVPPHRRGRLFGLRVAIGSVLAFAAGGLIDSLLGSRSPLPFPYNYAVLFAFSGLFLMMAQFCFMRVEEPEPEPSERPADTFWSFVRHVIAVIRHNRNASRYLLYRNLAPVAWTPVAFAVPFAMKELQLSAGVVSWFVVAGVVAATSSNVFWAWLSDRVGNRSLLRLGSAVSMVGVGLLALTPLIDGQVPGGTMPWALVWLLAVYALAEMGRIGVQIGSLNYIYELGSGPDVPMYIGSMNTFSAPALLLSPLLMGRLAETYGFTMINLIGMIFGAWALLLTVKLHEPRRMVIDPT